MRTHPLPEAVYALVNQTPGSILLEGAGFDDAGPAVNSGRFSRLFLQPKRVVAAYEYAELPGLFQEIETAVARGEFAAGCFAYECAAFFEPTLQLPRPAAGESLAWFGIYQRCYLFDHTAGAFLHGDPPGLSKIGPVTPEMSPSPTAGAATDVHAYTRQIEAIHNYIRAGDVYQLNYTFPLSVELNGTAGALFSRLSRRQPVPYAAFLHTEQGRYLLSLSPELFFRIEGEGAARRITTRPMKGTAARGHTTSEDRAQSDWLLADAKTRSENVMIVDLLRNDLGRLCRFGSVRVVQLFAVERYQTLWQMTSTVTGTLLEDAGFREIFRALFPCGSVTGAPKVRAIELLAELEQQPRGIYTGAIGFFSQQQTTFNVAIRTIEVSGGKAKMGVGSGIVIDSDPAAEWCECALKAEFLTRSDAKFPRDFKLIESLLWRNGYPLIEHHLDRLEDSASYFGFAFQRAHVKAALLSAAQDFNRNASHKVRLLLHLNGKLEIGVEPLAAAEDAPSTARVRIAKQHTDSRDRMLFHKTTHRPLYASEFQAAQKAGFDDVLFLNQRGEVTEGAISNVFIEQDGRYLTPPVECGLLAGVYRRFLLETRQPIEQRVLFLDDLRCADAVYLANAVRGLRRVMIEWQP